MKQRSFLMIVLVAVFSVATFQVLALTLKSQKDQLSYTMGVQTGKAFKANGVKVNTKTFRAGLEDALSGKKFRLSEKKMKSVLMTFRQNTLAKLKAKFKKIADKNARVGAAFLAANKRKPGVKTTANGLQYKVIQSGKGTTPAKTSVVTVNYKGQLINGKVFDSSYKRGKPATFPVNGVIPGWQEALTMMKPGAVWMLYIPSKLAYGKQGMPGAIGPNETLIFKVNLISIKKK